MAQPRVLPRDGDGYTQSFDADDEDGARAFFAQHGVVVVRGALAPDEVEATVDEIFSCRAMNAKTGAQKKSRTDPADWEDDRYPTMLHMAKKGFISPMGDVDGEACWMNRQNPRVYGAFRSLLGRDELVVSLDRYGVMRPTLVGGKRRDEWLTDPAWLHWDQNPWRTPGFKGVQGLLTLSDSRDDSGGFVCVPGMHADGRFAEWAAAHEPRGGGLVPLPDDDPLYAQAERVTAPPGCLVVWDSRIAHANFPNRSDSFRLVQYLTYTPAAEVDAGEIEWRRSLFEEPNRVAELPPCLTPLGRRLLGVDAWSPQ